MQETRPYAVDVLITTHRSASVAMPRKSELALVAAPAVPRLQAAEKLCKEMATFFPTERQRQQKFIELFNELFTGLGTTVRMHIPTAAEQSSGQTPTDGHCILEFKLGNTDVVITVSIVEVKNEVGSSGDPTFQIMLYFRAYTCRSPPTSHRQAELSMDRMFFPRASVVASEALTPMIPLLPIGSRQPVALWMVGRVLEALDASLQSLAYRYSCALQDTLLPLPDSLDALPAAHKAVLKMARFSRTQLQHAALARPVGDALRPYPLLARSFRSDDAYADIQLFTPPDGASKLMFTATSEESGRLLIKFSPHPYPTEVHDAWYEAGGQEPLVPKLVDCVELPGGWSMIVMELLGEDWKSLQQLPHLLRAGAVVEVAKALERAHSVDVCTEGGTFSKAVHGDVRAPNVLVRFTDDTVSGVRFVDLDWAGISGHSRYPHAMNPALPWHSKAKPGRVMEQEHDKHMLTVLLE
ncbi:hypothetical protein JKP88DRAFT_262308 [Tribonema minus]|uniref:Protein kinase domain-containing protein n=1 Tax=Tribonema minus TaxID=303371 RepID=A0A836CIK6_9STRA|nr:hypothetical protein JKP88DRAFT_262308 [Tribonema minus]